MQKQKCFITLTLFIYEFVKIVDVSKKLQLLLDQSTLAVLLILFFIGQKIPFCGKFNKKDCFGSSLFIIPVKHYRALTK